MFCIEFIKDLVVDIFGVGKIVVGGTGANNHGIKYRRDGTKSFDKEVRRPESVEEFVFVCLVCVGLRTRGSISVNLYTLSAVSLVVICLCTELYALKSQRREVHLLRYRYVTVTYVYKPRATAAVPRSTRDLRELCLCAKASFSHVLVRIHERQIKPYPV